jgi:SAM-dependent methyltransferase
MTLINKKASADAYGEELWSYFKTGEPKREIIEREDGLISLGKVGGGLYFSEYKNWSKIEKAAMKHVKGRVLDIGCGAGRHSLYLQGEGFDVTGIDNSPLAIKVCRLRGLKKAKLMSIRDIGQFEPRSFDTVIMMGNNFGLFGSYKLARVLLKKLHRITSPDALIIAATRDPYTTNDPAHLAYHTLNKKRGRMPGQLRIRVRYNTAVGSWFDYLLVSKDELAEILKTTEWDVKRFIDGNDGQYIMLLSKRDSR